MVKKKNKAFACAECRMLYAEKKKAEACEKWCKEHHSCNIELIKDAIGKTS
ncbi:MAG TPA: hypothetical protein VJC21_01380 [Candidatus Nanoarchaeia archaeon]|nr:hypothetical protein [Candidatus Nanoarchaeia archaeon]